MNYAAKCAQALPERLILCGIRFRTLVHRLQIENKSQNPFENVPFPRSILRSMNQLISFITVFVENLFYFQRDKNFTKGKLKAHNPFYRNVIL